MQGGSSTSGLRFTRRGGSPFFNESSMAPNNITNSINSTLSASTSELIQNPRTASSPPPTRHERERRTTALNMEWLKSSVKLLESALRERNKQMDIQRKEIEFLRKELRRKDEVIQEYENIIKEREDMEDMEKKELEILHKEVWTLRNDVMTKIMTIREQENTITELENKNEKLMSVMPPPAFKPRARAQGVSAEPAKRIRTSRPEPSIIEKDERYESV